MTQQPTSKKGGIWFFIVPIILLVALIVFNNFDFKTKRFSLFQATRFSPNELTELVDRFSVDYVAGECTSKKFVKYTDDKTIDTLSFYYFGRKLTSQEKDKYGNNISYRIEDMRESVTPMADLCGVRYRIKNKKDYLDFMAALEKVSIAPSSEIKVFCDGQKYFVVNNAIFIDSNYVDRLQGYVIYIFSARSGENAYSFVSSKSNRTSSFIRVLDSMASEDRALIDIFQKDLKRLDSSRYYYESETVENDVIEFNSNKIVKINGVYLSVAPNVGLFLEPSDFILYGKDGLNDTQSYSPDYFWAIERENLKPIRVKVDNKYYILDLNRLKNYQKQIRSR